MVARSKEFNSLFHGARLDKTAGDRLRTELDAVLKKHNGNFSRAAHVLGIGVNSVIGITRGKGNGSLGLAYLIAEQTGTPLKDIVGETLAKAAMSKIARIREDTAKVKKTQRPPPPPVVRPVPSAMKAPPAAPVAAQRAPQPKPSFRDLMQTETHRRDLAEKVQDGSSTEEDRRDFVAEYERMRFENRKLKDLLFSYLFAE